MCTTYYTNDRSHLQYVRNVNRKKKKREHGDDHTHQLAKHHDVKRMNCRNLFTFIT